MTGLVRRVFAGQILPLRSGLEHPENAFEDTSIILARATAGLHALQGRDKRRDDRPLRVGDEHGERVSAPLPPLVYDSYF